MKSKRKELSSIKAQLHGRLGAAVAEVDHQDLWQRATLAASLTGGSLSTLSAAVDKVERWLDWRCPEGVRVDRLLASVEDLRRRINQRSAGGIGCPAAGCAVSTRHCG